MIGWFRKVFRRRPPVAPPAPAVRPPMHWLPPGNPYAVCGEQRPTRWTTDGRWADCTKCKRQWQVVALKKFTNER